MAAAGSSSAANSPQLDVVIDGTWVYVPSVDTAGNITGVDVYSPDCGHPHGAIFVNQLGPFTVANWPQATSFYMLDDHGHALFIQRGAGPKTGMSISGIDTTINHCVTAPRPLGDNFDLLISIKAGPDAWVSSDTVTPEAIDPAGNTVPCFSGTDIPSGQVSALQTLSFFGVTRLEFCGAPAKLQALFPAPWSGSGSLIIVGESPYIPSTQHTRAAYVAMSKLAGLDLQMDYPLPRGPAAPVASVSLHPMFHTGQNCSNALIVLP